ncbi:phage major capsid protein [Roseovarius indicus]|uniref:Phage capsid protein n=1 Tax=Roseovarius indicus TaxID=540747 RepID=A0A0T5P8W2_9RHOB|nr:phage major capsid protein [Roseovarius indicus]KRS17525.1 phage capsid protein [Roseovarius indicus]QEW26728.1 phage major capsid protein, HK97 family [Roseovarius indicus]SFD60988.1 phage prohead protease, HK97 family/phage major capsid protein, HK97 family,TIGR01554 [Roseovarius indicus]
MDRAYATLEIKEMDEDSGTITGIASTPATDRMDDIVLPEGAKYQLPIPLLWQHNHGDPIGQVTEAKVTKKGIEIVANVSRGVTDEIDRYWKLIKAGLVRGLSIGFRGLEVEQIEGSWGVRFKEWEWLELSAVTIPANAEANIATVKEYAAKPAATGTGKDADSAKGAKSPGVTGNQRKPISLTPKEGRNMKTIAEQIAAFEAKRAASQARMEEIQDAAVERGESKTAEEKEEFDNLKAEVKEIDGELGDLRDLEATKAKAAKVVTGDKSDDASQSRDYRAPVRVKAAKSAPGVEFARLARAKAISRLDSEPAREVAKRLYGEDSPVTGILTKATVVGGESTSSNWAADLVGDETSVYADFVEYLRPMTIVGKFGADGVPALRTVPFRTPLISQTAGGSAYWVGEGAPKPLTALDFSRTTLDELKVATISVVTEELLRKSSPSADAVLRDSLAAAVAEKIDQTFIDPAVSASAGVSPASITNGVSATTSTGNDADAIREDIRALWATFVAANNPPTTAAYVMSSSTALALSLMQNPLGQPEFTGINMRGGTLLGVPVIASEYLSAVSAGGYVALVNASDIYFGDEGGVNVDMSREASLQMLDNPTNNVDGTATSMVSMFQTNSVAFRAERILNWSKRRSSAVALLDEVNWGLPTP